MKLPLTVLLGILVCSMSPADSAEKKETRPDAVEQVGSIESGEVYRFKIEGIPQQEKGRWKGAYRIDPDGKIYLPLAGKLKISGMAIPEAARAIEKHLKDEGIYTRAKVTLLKHPKG